MINKLSQQLGRSISLSDVEVECVSLGLSIIAFQLLGFLLAAMIGMLFDVALELFIVIFLYIPMRACPYGNVICDAIKRGVAKVYNSAGTLLFHGSAWQCTKCGQAYITEFDLGLPVGS